MDVEVKAGDNVARLRDNPYPGRGFVIGMTADGKHLAQVYWLMGRSENSRNRIFVHDGSIVFTESADPSKVVDPSLIIYNAMREGDGFFVVSNGAQTDAVHDELVAGGNFTDALMEWEYEPDAPNYTPRITAVCRLEPMCIEMAALVRVEDQYWHSGCNQVHTVIRRDVLYAGYGYCMHTYQGDGNPLPSFDGKPYLVPLGGSMIEGVALYFWDVLNRDNRIALAVKFINIRTGKSEVHIINGRTN